MLVAQYSSGRREKDKRIVWHCKCDCGNECDVDVNSLISGHTKSCGCFHKSFREQYIESILSEHSFTYISQYTFDDCKNIFCLPFDFYLPDYHTCIEYDGEQHFKEKSGMFDYKTQHRHDLIKNKYCFEHNIPLIRIPYNAEYNFNDLILETTRFLLTPQNEKEYYESRR